MLRPDESDLDARVDRVLADLDARIAAQVEVILAHPAAGTGAARSSAS